uniref:Uncharacterized protein n=1 Tax=Kalanchoe fedtschenkoi TaxID=63787 RepID=A0A7N0UMK2_KALFE
MRLGYLIGSYIDWLMFDLNRESGQMIDGTGTGCHRPVFVVFSLILSPGIDAGNHLSPLFFISLAFHSHKRRDAESWEALLALILKPYVEVKRGNKRYQSSLRSGAGRELNP